MDIAVYRVNENKCPSCGKKGIYFHGSTLQCINEKVHSDQILFKVFKKRE